MMSLSAHRLMPKRARVRSEGWRRMLLELGSEGRNLRLLASGPQGHPTEWHRRRTHRLYFMAFHELQLLCPDIHPFAWLGTLAQ